jgi:Ca2+-binding EF-hand superfamily protein
MFTKISTTALLLFSSSLALAQARDGAMLENADADHDGKVTRQEFTNARGEQFAKLDRNGDGFIDDSDSGERARRPQMEQRAAAIRARLDTNGDGKVSKEEFVSGPAPMFDQFDANHDDVLDAQEVAAARNAAQERFRDRRQQ